MSQKKRVFITGYGSVNCLNSGPHLARRMSAPPSRQANAELPHSYPIGEIDCGEYGDGKLTRRMDRFTLLAYVAVKQALKHAGVTEGQLRRDRSGLVMNTCYGPLDSTRRYVTKLIRDGAKKVPAAVFPNTVHNAFAGLITMELNIHGTNSTVSGQNPICYGLDMIREGRDDLMIVGGCDELLNVLETGMAASGLFGGSRARLDPHADGFDLNSNSFVLGEGAAVIVLESEESLNIRGGTALAEVLDYGMTNGLEGPAGAAFPADEQGIRIAMRQALKRSELDQNDISFISAAYNGLPRLAKAEAAAIDDVFGADQSPLVCNAKSAIGETLGAASTFSTLLAVDAIHSEHIPPIWHLAPSSSRRRFITGQCVRARAEVALVNSIDVGGAITSLAIRSIDSHGSRG